MNKMGGFGRCARIYWCWEPARKINTGGDQNLPFEYFCILKHPEEQLPCSYTNLLLLDTYQIHSGHYNGVAAVSDATFIYRDSPVEHGLSIS
jgi:hypothetical protein